MDRRTFLRGSSALCLAGYSSATNAATDDRGPTIIPMIVSCGMDRNGDFIAAGLLADGRVSFTVPLPERGHDIVRRPVGAEAVIVERRPGNTFIVLSTATHQITRHILVPANRHLYGHGAFSPDGARFFTVENDFASGEGVIGIHEARDGYRRLGEFRSGGIGPHQLSVSHDGRTITVANGGIRTHPDTGRSKLNIATMEPNITFLDAASGRIIQKISLRKGLHHLSIRHFDESGDGHYAIGMQFEGDRRLDVPLVALLDRREGIRFLTAPAPTRSAMTQYVGSIRFDTTGTFVAASCPRGNLVVVWNAGTGRFVHAFTARDASGLVPTGQKGEFLATGGDGALHRIDAVRLTIATVAGSNLARRWDNHARMIPSG